jgi:hypothetical protein
VVNRPGFLLKEGQKVKVYNFPDKSVKRRNQTLPGNWTVTQNAPFLEITNGT